MTFVFRAGSMIGSLAPEEPMAPQRPRREELWHQRHAAGLLSAGVPTVLLDK